jgi:hypothetical protein
LLKRVAAESHQDKDKTYGVSQVRLLRIEWHRQRMAVLFPGRYRAELLLGRKQAICVKRFNHNTYPPDVFFLWERWLPLNETAHPASAPADEAGALQKAAAGLAGNEIIAAQAVGLLSNGGYKICFTVHIPAD